MVSDAKIVHDTIHASQLVNVPISEIWDAYEDTSRRAIWGVPDGDSIIYEESRFYEGGQDRYRCGPADSLRYCVQLEYVKIVRGELIVYTETVRDGGCTLSSSLVTWDFTQREGGIAVSITCQVVSFIGREMIDGNRNGHETTLEQLVSYLGEGT
ncbi:SRPBCC domain-containing protein [Glutamicibacter sp.]|uniref:SRPBCC domain-containing protein n=1 Tax=Glutamicibacter sp. TaxID=1931995 RepID=UPI0028BDC570|nr:SRPBCC domain-containing protein [Glutamicibacter sp.]